ncbi:MAG TPA: hypothetical protein VMW24_02625, partial [Sedimentisphaerales bacterium]|nr:hypothetical protein [Sedimentisphaerales bacterium]
KRDRNRWSRKWPRCSPDRITRPLKRPKTFLVPAVRPDCNYPAYGGPDMAETIVESENAETVKFYWKVSSQSGGDYLQFYIDSTLKDQISGESGDDTG